MKKTLMAMCACVMFLGSGMLVQSHAAEYPQKTLPNLMAAVSGELEANAKYLAFADAADKEGYKEIAAIFRAISDAELEHANTELAIAKSYDESVERPKPEKVVPGTTKANLQAAINGETYEFTKMYVDFRKDARDENILDARGIFTIARLAEEVHAGIYADLLKNIDKFDKVKYEKIYRCPVCGNIIPTVRPMACPICGDSGGDFVEYNIV